MRSFLLAAKLAVVFAVVLGGTLAAVFHVFVDVAGHELLEVLVRLNAYQGVEAAQGVEALLAEGVDLDDPRMRERLAADRRRFGLDLTLEPWSEPPTTPQRGRHGHSAWVEVGGRRCAVVGLTRFRVEVPVLQGGEPVARLVVGASRAAAAVHEAFHRGLIQVAVAGGVAIVALTVYLTGPYRRMRRSMDRIAGGDLDHRVRGRGRDEIAAMGRSFNAMADRIRAMITGQKELLASVSHELRSPLARMKMLLALARDERPADRLDELEAEVDAIDRLVGELIAASRLELAVDGLTFEPVALAPLLDAAWARAGTARSAEGDRALRLEVRLAEDAHAVNAHLPLVARVFRNLFENAARYAPASTVTVTAERRDDRVRITVADDGPGADPELLGRLFEPFVRGDRARRPDEGAVGLGLMIVQRAVEAHGGTVRAEAAEPHGLAVIFDLPAGPGLDA